MNRYITNKTEDMVFDTVLNEELPPTDCAVILNGLLCRINRLKKECLFLDLLYECGVDNWEGFTEAKRQERLVNEKQ